MTSSILLSLAGDEGIPLVARIFPDTASEPPPGGVHEVVVPVVGDLRVAVPPGSYIISLRLPTGLELREVRRVGEGEEANVAFDARGKLSSGLERGDTFSLQGAVSELRGGGVEALGTIVAGLSPPAEAETVPGPRVRYPARKSAYGRADRSDDPVAPPSNRTPRDERITLALVDGSDFRGAGAWSGFVNVTAARRLASLGAVYPGRRPDAAVAELASLPPGCTRAWMRVVGPAGTELAAVPLPWETGQPAAFTVERTSSGRAATNVAVRDDVFGGLLTYLDQGRMSYVPALLESLEESGAIDRSIHGDAHSPLAACAAGYAFLATFSEGRAERWERRFTELARLRGAIPDCHVLLARFLTLWRGVGNTEAAAASVAAATGAGVPFYSTGLLMLRDMLTAGAGRDRAQRPMLDAVAPVAARCDPTRLFTVLRYPKS